MHIESSSVERFTFFSSKSTQCKLFTKYTTKVRMTSICFQTEGQKDHGGQPDFLCSLLSISAFGAWTVPVPPKPLSGLLPAMADILWPLPGFSICLWWYIALKMPVLLACNIWRNVYICIYLWNVIHHVDQGIEFFMRLTNVRNLIHHAS